VPARALRLGRARASPGSLGALLALPLDGWDDVDALLTRRALGELEPYTGRDLGFFVHWLPGRERALRVGAAHARRHRRDRARPVRAHARAAVGAGAAALCGRVRRHLTLFGVGVLLLLAWGHRLDAYALLGGGSGDGGAFAASTSSGRCRRASRSAC
jgi:hypothetical protein